MEVRIEEADPREEERAQQLHEVVHQRPATNLNGLVAEKYYLSKVTDQTKQ